MQAGRGGLFTADQFEAAVKPRAYYLPTTSLVCLEDTHNRSGGRVFPARRGPAIAARARERDIGVHLDGARLWNAHRRTGLALAALAEPADTVSVCFSKGLGAPVGSALVGSRRAIERARRYRRMLGGAMRQVGVLLRGGALRPGHHVERPR